MKAATLIIIFFVFINLRSQNVDSLPSINKTTNLITIKDKYALDKGELYIYRDSVVIFGYNTRVDFYFDTTRKSKIYIPSSRAVLFGKLTNTYFLDSANLRFINNSIYTFSFSEKNITGVPFICVSNNNNCPTLFIFRHICTRKRKVLEIYPTETVLINRNIVYYLEVNYKSKYTLVTVYFNNHGKRKYKLKT